MREARSLVDSGMVEDVSGVRLLVTNRGEKKIDGIKDSIQRVKLQTPDKLYQKRQPKGFAKTSFATPHHSPCNS